MKRVILVAHKIRFFVQFEKNDIRLLQENGYEVHVAANYQSEEMIMDAFDILTEMGVIIHQINFERSPVHVVKNTKALKQLKSLLNSEKFDFIHCHTPIGGVIARIAGKMTKTKVIYTAHGFHFFKGAPLKNWLLFYPVEWLCAHWTDILITINKEDYALAQKHMHAKKVVYIPGVGLDTEKFKNCEVDRDKKREELGLSENDIMLLSVGELNENKNHQVIIKAMSQLNNPNIHYFIAGQGDKKDYLISLSKELNLSENLHLLGFRSDVNELYKSADIFVFPSHREGLGLAAIEAMASGLPLVTANIHGINDYSEDGVTGFKGSPNNVEDFVFSIDKLAKDKKLREQIGKNNIKISEKYDTKNILPLMKKIYSEV